MRHRRIVIRVDSSGRMGSGNLVRCRTLARELRSRGAAVRFVCRSLPGDFSKTVTADGFDLTRLAMAPAASADLPDGDYSAWLGVTQEQDAEETVAAIAADPPDWLVVDHYSLDARWERALRSAAGQLLVVDDLANRPHEGDLLLDQNWFGPDAASRYQPLVPAGCRLLLGPRYALLRREFADERRRITARENEVRRVMVFFGGSDPFDMTGRALKALSAPRLDALELDLVIGANYLHRDALRGRAAARGKTVIHGPRPHLADLMGGADLALGAGGATTWERMCLGVPSLVVTTAENQAPISGLLHREGLIRLIGHADRVTEADMAAAIADEIATGMYRERSRQSMRVCDGEGAGRVADVLLGAPMDARLAAAPPGAAL